MKGSNNEHKNEQLLIQEGLKKNGKNAYKTTLEKGVSVTVLIGNNLCQVDPEGEVKVLSRLSKSRVKVTQRTFKLK